METNKTQIIQKLIDDQLPEKEAQELINKIKSSPEMKLEFALLMKIKQESRNKMKQELLDRMRAGADNTPRIGTAAAALYQIRAAAFSSNKITGAEDLPIDEDTIKDFLNSDEEEENSKDQ